MGTTNQYAYPLCGQCWKCDAGQGAGGVEAGSDAGVGRAAALVGKGGVVAVGAVVGVAEVVGAGAVVGMAEVVGMGVVVGAGDPPRAM